MTKTNKDFPHPKRIKVMKEIRDLIIGPNLKMRNHRNIMFLIGNDFAYTNSSTDFRIENGLRYLLKEYSEIDLGVKINVKIATPSDYFNQLTFDINLKKTTLRKYPFDFGQYDENTRHLDSERFKSMHRIDYWTGYHSNRGAHKALIKRNCNWLEITSNFINLFEIKKCSKSGDVKAALPTTCSLKMIQDIKDEI